MDTNTLCLGVLLLGDASGYDIKKMFEDSFSHFQAASFGSIYPALNKLSEQGMVSFREEQQDKRPNKKVFSITPSGREQFLATLSKAEPTEQYRSDFLVLMTFAHLLPPERLVEIIDIQLKNLQGELDILDEIIQHCSTLSAGMRFTVEYGIAANRALLELTRNRKQSLLREIALEHSHSGAAQ